MSEVFGPTLQGEGASIGRASAFLRLAGCSVRCRWCDTRYSWDSHQPDYQARVGPTPVDELWDNILDRLPAGPEPLLVVTGGEPVEQVAPLSALLRLARAHGCRIEIETSGVGDPGPLVGLVDLFTVSPKLQHAGAAVGTDHLDLAAFASTGRAMFKFVVRNNGDLDEAATIARRHPTVPVTVMPLGAAASTIHTIARAIAPEVARRGWTLSPRLHIDLWGNAPGR